MLPKQDRLLIRLILLARIYMSFVRKSRFRCENSFSLNEHRLMSTITFECLVLLLSYGYAITYPIVAWIACNGERMSGNVLYANTCDKSIPLPSIPMSSTADGSVICRKSCKCICYN